MENLLKKWKIDTSVLLKSKTTRKSSTIEDENLETMRFLEYNLKDHDEEGFIKIESTSRIKILREKNSKPTLLQNMQENYQAQVIHSTYAPTLKKKKLKSKYNTKQQVIKTKFLSIANVKSDWMEVQNFNLPNITKMSVKYDFEVLKDVKDNMFEVSRNVFNIKHKKPFSIKNPSESISFPFNILEDQYLMDIYKDLECKKDEFAFFMPDYVFRMLTTINKRNFPWNIKIMKEGNKYIFYAEISEENPFLIFQTYNENNLKKLPEDELKVANENQESSLCEENFYRLLSGKKNLETIHQNYRYVKLSLDKNFHIYTRINYDASNQKGKNVFLRAFNTFNTSWKDLDKNPKTILDRCLKNNIARVSNWIIDSMLTEVEEVDIAFIARIRKNEGNNHKILKVEKKKISEIIRFFNFKTKNCFVCLHLILGRILNLKKNGSFILHKEAFKSDLTLFRLSKEDN